MTTKPGVNIATAAPHVSTAGRVMAASASKTSCAQTGQRPRADRAWRPRRAGRRTRGRAPNVSHNGDRAT